LQETSFEFAPVPPEQAFDFVLDEFESATRELLDGITDESQLNSHDLTDKHLLLDGLHLIQEARQWRSLLGAVPQKGWDDYIAGQIGMALYNVGQLVAFAEVLQVDAEVGGARKRAEAARANAKKRNRDDSLRACVERANWQREAEAIWSRNPRHTKSAVADAIVKKLKLARERVQAVRKNIRKP
jgi:hypothetical protein